MSTSFSDMAPNAQRSLMITAILVVVGVVIYMFCIQPTEADLARAKQEYATLEDQRRATERDLKGSAELKQRLDEIKSTRQRFMDALLTPLLESYAMRAKSILDPLADDVGLKVNDYAELDPRALPLAKPAAPQLYARRGIKVTCTGSYAAIISFLLRVEQQQPLVALQAFTLKAQNDPEAQIAELVFEWPVLGVNTTPQKGVVKQ